MELFDSEIPTLEKHKKYTATRELPEDIRMHIFLKLVCTA